MALSLRRLRLRAVWLLVIPFLWLAAPTPTSLASGGALAVVGLLIRGWAAGLLRKEQVLATTGPYAHTRNPLYLGSFFLGLGVTVAGGQWYFVAIFAVFFLGIYGRTMRGEAELLEGVFGDAYRHYATNVPLLFPRLTRYHSPEATGSGSFTFERYRGNREYEALLGTIAGFAFLALRMRFG